MFAPPRDIQTTVFTRLPDRFRDPGRESDWTRARGSGSMHSFLEGPSFDRAGNLYACNRVNSTIEKFSPTGADLGVFAHTGGGPHFMAMFRPRRLYVAELYSGPFWIRSGN